MYLDAANIESQDLSDSIYTLGTLKIHHVKRLDLNTVDLYLNRYVYFQEIFNTFTGKKKINNGSISYNNISVIASDCVNCFAG